MIFGFWFHLRKRTFKSMLHEIYASPFLVSLIAERQFEVVARA